MKSDVFFKTGGYAPRAITEIVKDRRIKKPRRIGWQTVWVNEN